MIIKLVSPTNISENVKYTIFWAHNKRPLLDIKKEESRPSG